MRLHSSRPKQAHALRALQSRPARWPPGGVRACARARLRRGSRRGERQGSFRAVERSSGRGLSIARRTTRTTTRGDLGRGPCDAVGAKVNWYFRSVVVACVVEDLGRLIHHRVPRISIYNYKGVACCCCGPDACFGGELRIYIYIIINICARAARARAPRSDSASPEPDC